MFLAVKRESNEWSSQIIQRDKKYLASKWVMIGIMKAELCNNSRKRLTWVNSSGL
jgi:hypothetical protein